MERKSRQSQMTKDKNKQTNEFKASDLHTKRMSEGGTADIMKINK